MDVEDQAEADTVEDHHQVLVVDTVEDHLLEDQEATMAKLEKVAHPLEDTHLLVVMTTEADTEVDRPQALVVDTVEDHLLDDIRVDKEEDRDIEALRVEAMVVTRSLIADLVDTVSHDHLSLVEMHLIMHTLSEENNSSIYTKNSRNGVF